MVDHEQPQQQQQAQEGEPQRPQLRIREQIDRIDKRVDEHSSALSEQNEKLDTQIYQTGQLSTILEQVIKNQDEEREVARRNRGEVRAVLNAARMEQLDLGLKVTNFKTAVENVVRQVGIHEEERQQTKGGKEMLSRVLNVSWIVGTSIIAGVAAVIGWASQYLQLLKAHP